MGGSGGAPARYPYTAGAYIGLSSWSHDIYTYSIAQLNLGNNPLSRVEVVSSLNLFNQARYTYHYNYSNSPERYYPKVYLGTTQTVALGWIYDLQKIENYPTIWPEIKSQKCEA